MDALAAVHAEGILHRDISPDNIHLSKTGKVKLMDFGAARNALSQKSRNLSVILKEGYAPEEQYRSSGIQGPWTDVYATAATMYHCITGRIPQPSLDRAADDRLESPSQLGNLIPPAAEAALMKGMAVRASDRYQSMEDFRQAITGEPMPRPMAPPGPDSRSRPCNRLPAQAPPPASGASSMAPTVAMGGAAGYSVRPRRCSRPRPSAPPPQPQQLPAAAQQQYAPPPQAPPSAMPPTVPVQSQPPMQRRRNRSNRRNHRSSRQPRNGRRHSRTVAPPPQSQQPPQHAHSNESPPQQPQHPQYPPQSQPRSTCRRPAAGLLAAAPATPGYPPQQPGLHPPQQQQLTGSSLP